MGTVLRYPALYCGAMSLRVYGISSSALKSRGSHGLRNEARYRPIRGNSRPYLQAPLVRSRAPRVEARLTDLLRSPMVPPSSAADDPVLAGDQTDAVVQLIAQQNGLQAALDITQAILAGEEPATMWRLIARRARRLLWADAAIVRTVGQDGTTLVLRGIDPRRPSARQPGILLSEERVVVRVCEAVYEAGSPRIIGDVGSLTTAAERVLRSVPENAIGRMPLGPALIVPLGPKGCAIGTLMAVNRAGRPSFGRRDIDLLHAFAGQAALAVHQAELRRERQRLIVARERERLARELHDDALQSLGDITSCLASAADGTEDSVLRERMASLVRTVEKIAQDLWNHIYELRPSVLSGRSLEEALRQVVCEFEQQSGTTTVTEVETEAAKRLRDEAGDLVQIVKEALSNVRRHARAGTCRVCLRLGARDAWLLVQDDGVGFDPARIAGQAYGLRNFRERADRLGGRLEIESGPNTGTAIRVTIPLGQRQSTR
jgi:signal transduction histidine kinase